MLILKFNSLSSQDLFAIERRLFRWLDSEVSSCSVNPDFNVLDYGRTDLYGHLLGIFAKLRVFETIGVSPSQMLDFFVDVDTTYSDAPYHSFYHAVDIVTVLYFMLVELEAVRYLTNMEIAALLVAALCHDAGHPGYNNLYQVNFKTELAIRYSNTSVLESYSVDITRHLLRKHALLRKLGTGTTEVEFMDMVENFILSTDMVYHYELQEQVGSLEELLSDSGLGDEYWYDADISDAESWTFSESPASSSSSSSELSMISSTDNNSEEQQEEEDSLLNAEQRRSLCRILLHAADISNTVRPWPISKQWSDLIVQEFFRQGDAEKAAGLEVSPGMDRDQSTQPNISLKFGDFVVKPYFEALAGFLPSAQVFLDTLSDNRVEWERLKDCPDAATPPPPAPAHERQFPASLLPATPIINPPGRRISVAAGMVVIPDQQLLTRKRQRSTLALGGKHQRVAGYRSASHSGLVPHPLSPEEAESTGKMSDFPAYRRRSEQTYLGNLCASPTLLRPIVFEPSPQDKYIPCIPRRVA